MNTHFKSWQELKGTQAKNKVLGYSTQVAVSEFFKLKNSLSNSRKKKDIQDLAGFTHWITDDDDDDNDN